MSILSNKTGINNIISKSGIKYVRVYIQSRPEIYKLKSNINLWIHYSNLWATSCSERVYVSLRAIQIPIRCQSPHAITFPIAALSSRNSRDPLTPADTSQTTFDFPGLSLDKVQTKEPGSLFISQRRNCLPQRFRVKITMSIIDLLHEWN